MTYFIRLALEGLRYNKARAMLTGLGVFVGVGSVVLILVLTDSFFQGMSSGGQDRFTVGLSSSAEAGLDVVAAMEDPLIVSRVEGVRSRAGIAAVIDPEEQRTVSPVLADGTRITDVGVAFVDEVPVTAGLTLGQTTGNVAVAYDNPDFEGGLTLNSRFTIDGLEFTVIGVTEHLGEDGATRLHLPRRLADRVQTQARNGGASFTVVAAEPTDLPGIRAAALTELNDGLDPRLRFIDYSAEEAKALAEAAQSVGMFLGLIASISLAVAALNIVTVMYIATLERADEIAIYRSMGMTKRGILGLFLLESVVVAAVFALAGCLVGNLIALGIVTVMKLPMRFAWGTLLILLVSIVLIGAGGGLYPAKRAAAIDPVRLMR